MQRNQRWSRLILQENTNEKMQMLSHADPFVGDNVDDVLVCMHIHLLLLRTAMHAQSKI